MKKRRPYILDACTQKIFENAKDKFKHNYIKEKHEYRNYFDHMRFDEDCESVATFLCIDDLISIGAEDVGWLMAFIIFGVLTSEFGERVDFVEDELRDILINNHMERLKHKITSDDYQLMLEDLKTAQDFYGIT